MNQKSAPIRSQKSKMTIGKTTYNIMTTFSENATETVEEKFVRYVADRITSVANGKNERE